MIYLWHFMAFVGFTVCVAVVVLFILWAWATGRKKWGDRHSDRIVKRRIIP